MSIPPFLRTTLRVGLGLLIAIPVLAVILIGSGLLFLRSDTGERWVERAAAEHLPAALAGSGLSIRFGRLSGPLPRELRVTDLRISDPRGVFLTVPEAAVRLRLTALLSGTVAVDTLLVRDPVLHRLPELPEAEEVPPAPEPSPFTFAKLGDTGRAVAGLLPRLRLDGVRLANARIALDALGLPHPPSSDAPLAPDRSAQGSAEHTPSDHTFLSATLTGDGPLTDWHANLSAAWPGVADLAGELFLGNTGAWLRPAGSAAKSTAGSAAFTPDVGARVRLALRLTPDSAAPAGSPQSTRSTGQQRDHPAAQETASETNAPGKHLPRDAAAPDSDLTVTLLAGLTATSEGTLVVPEVAVRLPGIRVDGDLAAADAALRGALTLVLDDPHALAALMRQGAGNGLPVPEIDLPLREATLNLALSGRPDAPELKLDAQTRGLAALEKHLDATAHLRLQAAGLLDTPIPADASTQDTVPTSTGGQDAASQNAASQKTSLPDSLENAPGAPARPIQLDLDATVAVKGLGTGAQDTLTAHLATRLEKAGDDMRLNAFSCRLGEDLVTVAAQGRFHAGNGATALTLRAAIPALDRLPLGALLSLPETPAGALNLETHLESSIQRPGSSLSELLHVNIPPLTATLSLTGTGMRWRLPLLDKALGKTPSLSADLRLPPRADLGADTVTARLAFTAAAIEAQGEASLNAASAPDESRLDADVRLNLPALAAFDPLVPDLSGSLAATLKASGPLSSPQVELTATSPTLRRAESALTDLRLALKAAVPGLYQDAGKAPQCNGTARLDALVSQAGLTSAKGEPVRLSTQWNLRPATSAEPGQFTLGQLNATAPGITLSGALNAALPRTSEAGGQNAGGQDAPVPRLDGHLDLDVADWTLINTAAGLKGPDRIHSKTARLHVALIDGPAQGARAEVNLRDLHAPDTTVSRLQATLQADDIFGAARVAFAAQSGPGTAAGRSWREGRVRVNGPLSQLAADLSLKGEVEADLGLTLDAPGGVCRIDRLRAKDGPTGLGLRLNAPLEASFRPDGVGTALRVRGIDAALLPSGALKGDALLAPEALDVAVSLKDLKLGVLRPLLNAPLPDADVTADARISRSAAQFPSGAVTVRADDIRYAGSDMPPVAFRLDATLESSNSAGGSSPNRRKTGANQPGLRATAVLSGVGPSDFVAEARLPLERALGPDGLPRPDMRRPLTGSAHWKGSLAPLWSFVPLADRRVTGEAALDAVLSGTLAAPELSADLNVSGGQYEDILLGLLLTDITADLRLRSAGESRLSVSLGDGQGGTASLEGSIGPLDKGLPLALKGAVDSLAPLHRNDLSIVLSGDAGIFGPAMTPADLAVRAAISVDRGEFNLVGSFGSSIPTLDVITVPTADASASRAETSEAAEAPGGPLLDVNVALPGRFFVRGRGLESEWRGDLTVKGPAAEPLVLGTISSVRGTLQLLGKEFALSRGNVLFTGSTPPMPSLDIALTYEGPSITADATLSGTATSPSLKFSSRPPLPEDEVVSQILFGQSAGSLSRLEALQLANELRMLASGGPGVFGTARDALGMDVIRFKSSRRTTQQPAGGNAAGQINPGQTTTAENDEEDVPTLEVGKYVMDNVYVGLEQGMNGEDSGVRVEIELTPRLSLEASTTSRGSEVGASWKKDY